MNADIVVRPVAGEKFTQEVDNGRHPLLADEPEAKGGADKGPTPYELLLGALGT
jgi:putative redox protein